MRNKKLLKFVQFSLLLAIEAIVCFTPLGSIPIGPIVATLALVPVVITAVVLGTGAGTLMGFFAGLFSLIVWTFTPPNPALAFVFTPFYSLGELGGSALSLLICFVPRILSGTVSGLLYGALKKAFEGKNKRDLIVYGVSGLAGSLVNTFGVLFGIYFAFGQSYAEALGVAYSALMGLIGVTILTNGIPEAIIAGIAAYAIGKPVNKYVIK